MQKFQFCDHVQVADDLGPSMKHFSSGCEAIVLGSYADKFGGDGTKIYTLHIKDEGECSWYHEDQLTLIKKDQCALLAEWQLAEQIIEDRQSDLDWIFNEGEKILRSCKGPTAVALGKCLGMDNLWGSNGEGFVFQMNARSILEYARPYLVTKDKDGWLLFCEQTAKENGGGAMLGFRGG